MLQAINDRIKGWLGIAVVALIGLPFALWGVSSYFDDAGPSFAAKVNGVEISANSFERAVSSQRQSLLRRYEGKLPIGDKELRERTLTQLIDQQVIEYETFVNGYRISDGLLSNKITQIFTVDGVFSRDNFESTASSLGMNISGYENTLRSELRLQQMRSAIINSSFVTKSEINNLALLNEQTRDFSVLTFNVDHFSTAAKPAQEEIKQYYEANLQRFMAPEKLKIDYVEIDSASLSKNVEIDETQIKKMYEDYVSSISGREERNAQHILLQLSEDTSKVKKQLESIKQDIANGASFSEMAKKHSQDTISAEEGGDLGWIATGDMTEPFEKVLFSMEENSLSEVFETRFGYHLIKLNNIRSEAVESLDIKRYGFEEELKADSVASMFYDLTERLASIAYENPDSLDVIVDELGLKVSSSEYFTRADGQGIAESEKVRSIAYSSLVLEQGSNSDVIEIDQEHVVVVRLNQHQPAVAIPLEDVTSKIENILKLQNGREKTKTAALKVKAKLEAGDSVDSQKVDGITVANVKGVGRKDFNKVSSPAILNGAFEISPNQDGSPSYKVIDLNTGDVALLILISVIVPDNIAEDKLQLVKNEALRENAIRDYTNTIVSMKDKADIEKNIRIIER